MVSLSHIRKCFPELSNSGPRLAFMNAKLVAIGIENDGRPASGKFEWFLSELNFLAAKVSDGFVKIVHFQDQLDAVARGFEEWFFPDGQRVRADFIFDPESVRKIQS